MIPQEMILCTSKAWAPLVFALKVILGASLLNQNFHSVDQSYSKIQINSNQEILMFCTLDPIRLDRLTTQVLNIHLPVFTNKNLLEIK